MCLAAGTWREAPQQTHRWNNQRLTANDIADLDLAACTHGTAQPEATKCFVCGFPIFHVPILGDWRDYVILTPKEPIDWHVGWYAIDSIGISRIHLTGAVRLLRGSQSATFFGCNIHGEQVPLQQLGHGRIGNQDSYAHTPLL